MNDAGSVICWFWDIFLLITQRSSTGKFEAQLTAWLVSGEDKLRWLRSALEDGSLLERSGLPMRSRSEASKLPVDTMYDRAADRVAGFAGLPFTQVRSKSTPKASWPGRVAGAIAHQCLTERREALVRPGNCWQ